MFRRHKPAQRYPHTVPVMNGQRVQLQVAQVAEAIHARTDDLALVLARAISREVHLYREAAVVPFDVLTASCAANVGPNFAAIAGV